MVIIDHDTISSYLEYSCKVLDLDYNEVKQVLKDNKTPVDMVECYLEYSRHIISFLTNMPEKKLLDYPYAAKLDRLAGNMLLTYHMKKSNVKYDKDFVCNLYTPWYDTFSKWYKKEDLIEALSYIAPDRDYLYTYAGIKLLLDSYLVKVDDKFLEAPQHRHIVIALYLNHKEMPSQRMRHVKNAYEMFSTLKYINPTPVMANAGRPSGGLISCLLMDVQDDSNSILDGVKEAGIASKQGCGLGIDISRIRSEGSDIGVHQGVASGKIPFMKLYSATAMAFDQNRKRPGAFALYIECWDAEFFDFINTKKISGDERLRVRDVFLGIIYRDLFFKREKEDGEWTLFDSKDASPLHDLIGEDFEREYIKLEEKFKQAPKLFNPKTMTVKCRDILRFHLNSWSETGQPFFFFKDTVNKSRKTKEVINITNLCTEVTLPTSPDYTAVCNLGSINLARIKDNKELIRVTKHAVRLLDNVITVTKYPSDKTKRFQARYRSIGLGTLGEAEAVVKHGFKFGSKEHQNYIDEVWRTIEKTSKTASDKLGNERGMSSHEDSDTRNIYRHCIAPNTNSAILAGTSNGIEPFYSLRWVEENQRGTTLHLPGDYDPSKKHLYKGYTAFDIQPEILIKLASIRQKHIDMSMSLNIFIRAEDLSVKRLRDIVVKAWESGLKTIYYLRTTAPTNANRKVKCVGCVN